MMNTELTELGDRIETAVAADITRTAGRPESPRWRRKAVAIPAGIAIAAGIGVGTAAAAGLFSPAEQVAHDVVHTSLIFAGSTATCTTADEIVFQCTLDVPPTGEPAVSYQRGAVYEYATDGKVAGGCRGQDEQGLQWTCYAGDESVKQGIISQEMLGKYVGDSQGVG